ncbi:unnamed protein product [Caenorhabditis auriculariae]|uniref:Uncharacterized protein n=1 Tax=Caenorhabditis auriculariae TaxID=2777116 RepID=A0A8S1HL34_9PELO|nr:unnamed protein product [Caenorhabditis auriculariae]
MNGTVCKHPVHQEHSELSQAHQSEVRMDNPARDESRQPEEGRRRPPPEEAEQDPPPPTHSVRLSPHQVENLTAFLEWNQLLSGQETAAYELAVRRDRRGVAMADIGEGTARSREAQERNGIEEPTNTMESGEAVTDGDSMEVEETDGEMKEEKKKEEKETEKEKEGEGEEEEGEAGAEPPQISNKTEEKVKFTAVHEGMFRHNGAQKENGRVPLRAAAESHAPSKDPGVQLRRGKEMVQKAPRGKAVVLRLSMLAERLDEDMDEMRMAPDEEERRQDERRLEEELLDLESSPASRQSPQPDPRQEDQEEGEESTSSSSSSSAPWPEELEDVYELFDLESIEEFDEETGSSDSSDSFFLGQHARERIALAWARRNLLELPEEEDDVAEAPRAEETEPLAVEAVEDAAEILPLQDEEVPEAEETGNEANGEEKEDGNEDGEVVEDEEADDQAGPAAQPAAAAQQAATCAGGLGQARKHRAGQRPRPVAQRASRRLRGLGVGQAVRRVPPALAGHSAAQLLVKIREELEAKLADGGAGDEELRRVGRLSSAMTSLKAIQKGRVVTDVQFERILRKIEGGY